MCCTTSCQSKKRGNTSSQPAAVYYKAFSKTSEQTILTDSLTCFPHVYSWKGQTFSFISFRDDVIVILGQETARCHNTSFSECTSKWRCRHYEKVYSVQDSLQLGEHALGIPNVTKKGRMLQGHGFVVFTIRSLHCKFKTKEDESSVTSPKRE